MKALKKSFSLSDYTDFKKDFIDFSLLINACLICVIGPSSMSPEIPGLFLKTPYFWETRRSASLTLGKTFGKTSRPITPSVRAEKRLRR